MLFLFKKIIEAKLRRAAVDIGDEQPGCGRLKGTDYEFALFDDGLRFGEVKLIQWHAKNFAARRAFTRKEVESIVFGQLNINRIATKLDLLHLVFETSDLLPFPA